MKKKMQENLINENILNTQEEIVKPQANDAKKGDIILTEEIKASIIQNIPSNIDDKNKNPKKLKQKNGWVTFGFTLSIIAFVLSMYNFVAKLSFLFIALYYLILILIMFFTLFTILANDGFQEFLSGGESLTNMATAMQTVIPYTAGVASAFSVAAIIILSLQKNYKGGKKVAGIVFSSISIVISIIVLVLHYIIIS